MKILWYSTSPEFNSGYGVASRALITRLKQSGYFVRVGTKHDMDKWHIHDGVEIFPGRDPERIKAMFHEDNFDWVFSLFDIWTLPDNHGLPQDRWAASIPVDTQWMHDPLKERVKQTGLQVAMSRHGQHEIEKLDLTPMYAPLGFDESIFKPDDKGRAEIRKEHGIKDTDFLVGSVGLNYGVDDRKGFIPLLRAWKEFSDRHNNAHLYLHTHWHGKGGAVNYAKIAKNLGIKPGTLHAPHQLTYDINAYTTQDLANIYNAFDAFALASRGEGFGLPTIEAQACGVPVIVADNTTGPELCRTGWLIPVDDDTLEWSFDSTWRHKVKPSAIAQTLDRAYDAWKTQDWEQWRSNACERIQPYTWNNVWEKYWLPVFDEMGKRLEVKDEETQNGTSEIAQRV